MENKINTRKTVLLTGAGFTRDFGGYLADEMWVHIFNDPRIQQSSELRAVLVDYKDFDYEGAFQRVKDDEEFSPDLKKIFNDVLLSVYEKMDQIIQRYREKKRPGGIATHERLNKFLKKFTGDNLTKGFIFTLNQDMFIERHYWGKDFKYLGIPGECIISSARNRHGLLHSGQYKTLNRDNISAGQKEEYLSRNESFYVKLHGSFHWKQKEENEYMIIAGQRKKESLLNYPLLEWYKQVFEEVLSQGGVKLLVIGYSFLDEHINEIISQAIQKKNLSVYILSPKSPRKFRNELKSQKGYGLQREMVSDLFDIGLKGYFVGKLKNVFPEDQTETQIANDIEERIFA